MVGSRPPELVPDDRGQAPLKIGRGGDRYVPAEAEDGIGIATCEAQACGTPVIGARAGGARESVRDGVTGILLDHPDARSIAESVRALESAALSPRACREFAERFSEDRFTRAIDRILIEELGATAGASGDRELADVARRSRSRPPAR